MTPGEYRDRGIYLPGADALVVADLHVGRDETSNVEFPLGERSDLLDRLGALLDAFDPREVVFAGDVLHAFDGIPRTVEETLATMRERVRDAGTRLVVTPGNHDAMLSSIYDGPTKSEYRLDDGETVVLHGHERPAADADRYVIGHDHPAIVIEGQKHPCALYGEGTYRGAEVIVLPSFNRLARGTRVNGLSASDAQSPLLAAGSLDDYRPVVADGDEPLAFPPLGQFRELL